MAKNPRSRRPSDFKYSKVEEREKDSTEAMFPVYRDFLGIPLSRWPVIVASSWFAVAGLGYFIGSTQGGDGRTVSDLQAALRSSQAELKTLSDSNAKLRAENTAAKATIAKLQKDSDAFVDACESNSDISRSCPNRRKTDRQ